MEYRMIFSDMDGTLLESDTQISEKNKKAIASVIEKGIEFTIATGRGIFGVKPFLKELNLIGRKGYVVCQNGGTVYNLTDMSLSISHTFLPETIKKTVLFARTLDLEINYYDNHSFIAERITEGTKAYCEVMGVKINLLEEPLNYEGTFTKALISGNHEKLLLVQEIIKETTHGEIDSFFSNDIYLEVVKHGVNKGNSMVEISKQSGIPLEQIIAVGDGGNDISMIEKAGLGIAVANASENVKEIADVVLEKSHNEDAIAELIYRYILKG